MTTGPGDSRPIDPRSLAEFCCWTALLLVPMLRWVHGPAVSADQAVVRTAAIAVAAGGAVALRAAKILRRRTP